MKCNHVGPAGESWAIWCGDIDDKAIDSSRPWNVYACSYCGERMPYPPSNDAPADAATARAMEIEIRAAQIAQSDEVTAWPSIAIDGWDAACNDEHPYDGAPPCFDDGADKMWWWAGWLARDIAIATHAAPTGGGQSGEGEE